MFKKKVLDIKNMFGFGEPSLKVLQNRCLVISKSLQDFSKFSKTLLQNGSGFARKGLLGERLNRFYFLPKGLNLKKINKHENQFQRVISFQFFKTTSVQKLALAIFSMGLLVLFNACSDAELVSMKRLNNGVKLYEKHCSNCHQADGSGLAQLIPPLKGSDYLAKQALDLPCMIKNGMNGPLKVNGVNYNQAMPANKTLSPEDIADICVYVWQKFPTQPLLYPDSLVRTELKKCP